MQILAIIGLGQILLFLVLILLKRPKRAKDHFLGIFLFLIGLELLYRYYEISISTESNNLLIILDIIYWAALGPAMYLYVVFTIKKDKKPEAVHLLHLLPVLLVIVPFFRYLNSGNTDQLFFLFVSQNSLFDRLVITMWDFISPVYYVFVIIKLVKHRRNVVNYFSDIHKKDLKWALYFSSGFMVFILVGFLAYYFNLLSNIKFVYPFSEISVVVLVIYVLGVGLFGYRQEGIFSQRIMKEINQFNIKIEDSEPSVPEEKYIRSGLDSEESKVILQKLQDLMIKEKEYLDFELTITQLANKLDTSIHKLSQVINSEYNQNFYDFINNYRIEEVKRRLNAPQYRDYKILAIAYDCGFNSKSAFYSSFKKVVHVTPTQYREQIKRQNRVYAN